MEIKPHKRITPKFLAFGPYLAEVWQARGLMMSFVKRDLRIQFAQTYLGVAWSLLQPLTALLIFSFFFNQLVKIDVGVPYSIFAFSGIMAWYYFSQIVGQAGISLMSNQQLIRKVSFPRLILPLSKALVGLVEFCISLLLLLVLLFIYEGEWSLRLVFFPLGILLNIFSGLSLAIWLSALTIRFRDFHHIIPFLVGFGIWITPVFYPQTLLPQSYQWIYFFHPIANVINFYRWMITGVGFNELHLVVSASFNLLLLIFGLIFFIRNEKFIADHI